MGGNITNRYLNLKQRFQIEFLNLLTILGDQLTPIVDGQMHALTFVVKNW
jgi:hypothetical protein